MAIDSQRVDATAVIPTGGVLRSDEVHAKQLDQVTLEQTLQRPLPGHRVQRQHRDCADTAATPAEAVEPGHTDGTSIIIMGGALRVHMIHSRVG
jgi:hypothetical protein